MVVVKTTSAAGSAAAEPATEGPFRAEDDQTSSAGSKKQSALAAGHRETYQRKRAAAAALTRTSARPNSHLLLRLQEGSQRDHHDHNLSHQYRVRHQFQLAARLHSDAAGRGARWGESAWAGGVDKHRSVRRCSPICFADLFRRKGERAGGAEF